jgi:hypothetical protein
LWRKFHFVSAINERFALLASDFTFGTFASYKIKCSALQYIVDDFQQNLFYYKIKRAFLPEEIPKSFPKIPKPVRTTTSLSSKISDVKDFNVTITRVCRVQNAAIAFCVLSWYMSVSLVSNIRILWSMTLGIVLWRMWNRYQESRNSNAPSASYQDGKYVGGQQKANNDIAVVDVV